MKSVQLDELCHRNGVLSIGNSFFPVKRQGRGYSFINRTIHNTAEIKGWSLATNTFQGQFQYKTFSRERSAMRIHWDGEFNVTMFMEQFDKIIKMGLDLTKPIFGEWGFKKRGMNYSLYLHQYMYTIGE